MKFSNTILIFLFFSSVSGAYYYALKRTDGNVYQSIMFTMYFLALPIQNNFHEEKGTNNDL